MSKNSNVVTMMAAVFLGPVFLLRAESVDPPAPGKTDATAEVSRSVSSTADAASQAVDALPSAPRHRHGRTPRVELFLGYSYFRAMPTFSPGNRMVDLNGGTASLAFNFNRYFGLVGDFAGYRNTQLQLTGLGANPERTADSDGKVFTYMGGPRLSYRRYERLTPFAQVLVGGIHASPVTLSNCTGAGCTPLPSQNALVLTAGGGLDLKLQRHLALRLVQAEYMMTRFANVTTGSSNTQNDLRLASGLVLRFGGSPPPLPVTYSCSANPGSIYPGDPLSVTGTAANLNPKRTAAYSWTTDGGRISGSSTTATVDSRDISPGTYTAKGHVSEGSKPGHFADCTASYTVLPFQPPTVSCSASPATVRPGDSSTIAAHGDSPQGRALTYSYTASQGSISGATNSAVLNTSSSTSGAIAVTCNVVDDKGQTASAPTTVSVEAPAPQPAPVTQQLCSLHFDRDPRRPTRVDNEGKACLDDVALSLQRSTLSKVAIEGNSDAGEKASHSRSAQNIPTQRAVNAREYLVTEKGIDASRVDIYTGSSDSKVVNIILIPSGASLDATGLQPANESALPSKQPNVR